MDGPTFPPARLFSPGSAIHDASRSHFSELAAEDYGRIYGENRKNGQRNHVREGCALLIRAKPDEGDESIHDDEQKNGAAVHFTTPLSGLDAVA